jgi:hypothetical protein
MGRLPKEASTLRSLGTASAHYLKRSTFGPNIHRLFPYIPVKSSNSSDISFHLIPLQATMVFIAPSDWSSLVA